MGKLKECECGDLFEPVRRPNSTIKSKKCFKCLISGQKHKELKEKCKKLSEYKAEARKVFQAWVRLRDKNESCISCTRTEAKQWDGGHYLKAEIYSGLIFDEDNCHKQCSYCNDYLQGNPADYRQNLLKRIGLTRLIWLEQNKDRLRLYKYSKEELIKIKNSYQLKIIELKTLSK